MWTCFCVESSGSARVYLRRYAEGQCDGGFYHDARVPLGIFPDEQDEDGHWLAMDYLAPHPTDERWPVKCESCEYVFRHHGDYRQVSPQHIYRAEDGQEWSLRELPPGAMFDTPWMKPRHIGEDGLSLSVMLPPSGLASIWHVDGPSSDGGHWSRTGTPPKITAQPSILTGSYHGFLQDGVLTDSLPDRPLD